MVPNSVHTKPGEENFEKIAKKFKKLKNPIPELFIAKTGWDRLTKREKNFSPEFRSYSTQARKFRKNSKKILKIKKLNSGIISMQKGMKEAEKETNKF